jgi:glycosyltransferase involved in cell wall biosynthesis
MLYVSPLYSSRIGGRERLSSLHLDCLREIVGDRLDEFWLDPSKTYRGLGRIAQLAGWIDGATREAAETIVSRLATGKYDKAFLNGSNLGLLARAIRKNVPDIEVMTFCHNVEARFFADALRISPSPRALAVLAANAIAEFQAVRSSHRLLALSARDGELFRRLYGRRASDVLPMALDDQYKPLPMPAPPPFEGDYLLFVGTGFFANREGIRWFARRVATRLACTTLVVGRGLDDLRSELEAAGAVKLVGAVDDLGPYYRGAMAVIAPIFGGSGMKTKVAEGLMFGKHVIGTKEAFSGYEPVARQAGQICESSEEFVSAIRDLERSSPPSFDKALRALFERHYSKDAAKARLAQVLTVPPRSELED